MIHGVDDIKSEIYYIELRPVTRALMLLMSLVYETVKVD